mmetsp:Transcript_13930/g.35457  ORF Transcript_13930/g.35457 Transcript_13930/m.35457 type:complete len:294 (-) Transcript_13930:256-1137(-)
MNQQRRMSTTFNVECVYEASTTPRTSAARHHHAFDTPRGAQDSKPDRCARSSPGPIASAPASRPTPQPLLKFALDQCPCSFDRHAARLRPALQHDAQCLRVEPIRSCAPLLPAATRLSVHAGGNRGGGGEGDTTSIGLGGDAADGVKKKLSQMMSTIMPMSAQMIAYISALFACARRPMPCNIFFDRSRPVLAEASVARVRSICWRCESRSCMMLLPIASVSSATCLAARSLSVPFCMRSVDWRSRACCVSASLRSVGSATEKSSARCASCDLVVTAVWASFSFRRNVAMPDL